MTDEVLIIDLPNIKYCTLTIIFNETENIFTQISRYFNISGENTIISTDTIIIEKDSDVIEFNKNNIINNMIKFNYYSYGVSSNIIPKSIVKKNNSPFYLSLIESAYDQINDETNEKYKYIRDLFVNYSQKINHDITFYTCVYKNIYNNKICFGVTKIKYTSDKTSKYIIGYDKNLLDFEEVKSIIKEIFIK